LEKSHLLNRGKTKEISQIRDKFSLQEHHALQETGSRILLNNTNIQKQDSSFSNKETNKLYLALGDSLQDEQVFSPIVKSTLIYSMERASWHNNIYS
jgi:predicted mannosyl-3-phosphoglycerate phosphatase (HAD superfamily)